MFILPHTKRITGLVICVTNARMDIMVQHVIFVQPVLMETVILIVVGISYLSTLNILCKMKNYCMEASTNINIYINSYKSKV